MRFGILGTGVVGQTIGKKLVERGHDVRMGARDAGNAKAAGWVSTVGGRASHGTFADAAEFGEIVFNCTAGSGAVSAVHAAGAANLDGKIIIDVSNPLDFSKGFPPFLSVCNTDSLGEQIQSTAPGARVVKALNTVNTDVMVKPSIVSGEHDLFIAGNDAEAKQTVAALLRDEFGWKIIHDVGDITAARGTEMLLPLWVRLYGAFKTGYFNFHIAR